MTTTIETTGKNETATISDAYGAVATVTRSGRLVETWSDAGHCWYSEEAESDRQAAKWFLREVAAVVKANR